MRGNIYRDQCHDNFSEDLVDVVSITTIAKEKLSTVKSKLEQIEKYIGSYEQKAQ